MVGGDRNPRFEKEALLTVVFHQAQTARALLRLQIEMLGFARHRIDAHLEAMDRLLAAERVEEAQEIVLQFTRHTADDYWAQGRKLSELGMRIVTDDRNRH